MLVWIPPPLHLNHCRPHVDGGDHIQTLTLIGAQVKPFWPLRCFQVSVDGIGPALPPDLRILLVVPIHGVFLVAFPVAGWQSDAFAVLIQVVHLSALGEPLSMFVHGSKGQHYMAMNIVSGRGRVMDSKVSDHPLGNKLLLAVVPDHLRVLFRRNFFGQSQHEAPGQLGVPLFLGSLHRVPEGFPVGVLRRSVGWQHDFRVQDATLAGVVFGFLIVLRKQLLAALVGCTCHR